MRQQVRLRQLVGVVGKALFAHPVVRRLPVLQPFAAGNVRKRQQKVVDVVVVRCVQRIGLAHQVAHLRQQRRPQIRILAAQSDTTSM